MTQSRDKSPGNHLNTCHRVYVSFRHYSSELPRLVFENHRHTSVIVLLSNRRSRLAAATREYISFDRVTATETAAETKQYRDARKDALQ